MVPGWGLSITAVILEFVVIFRIRPSGRRVYSETTTLLPAWCESGL